MDIVSVQNVFFQVFQYNVSYIEFVGTIAGIIAVWLAAKNNVLTWPIGLINIILFFFIFFQVRLYSDMLLQVYFFAIGVYGWFFWKGDPLERIPIKLLSVNERRFYVLLICFGTLIFAYLIGNLHLWFPSIFPERASYVYWDSLVAVMSIVANTLLARRIVENWWLWILVNCICIVLYYSKGIVFVSFEYFIFLILAIYGLANWNREIKQQFQQATKS